MKNKLRIFLSLLTCAVVAVANQNCGEQSAASFSLENLSLNHSPSILDVDQPKSRARVGDRVFIASVMAEVFLPQGQSLTEAQSLARAGSKSVNIKEYISNIYKKNEDQGIVDTISSLILENVEDFQGPCSVIEADETCRGGGIVDTRVLNVSVDTVAPGSVNKEGFRLSACNDLLDNDRAVSNMVYNLKGKRSVKMSEKDVIDVYDLFYPAQPIDEEAYEALVEVYESAKDESLLNVWRAVALPVCQSSGWQVP